MNAIRSIIVGWTTGHFRIALVPLLYHLSGEVYVSKMGLTVRACVQKLKSFGKCQNELRIAKGNTGYHGVFY